MPVSRQQAEALLREDGDFLVRDSISQPGELVLTCRWAGHGLSFMINKVVNEGGGIQGRISPVSYQFEEDAFFTIQELIYNYRQRRKPITQASGAVLKNGIPRSVPLNYYKTNQIPGHTSPNTAEAIYAPAHIHKRIPLSSPTDSPEMRPHVRATGRTRGGP